MSFGNANRDEEFDHYRKQRIRSKKRVAPDQGRFENPALRELEMVEEREAREQQLTREVHDFFSSATQQAATIVERMANDAVAEADIRIEQEMESFLIDSFARMNKLVLTMLEKRRGSGGEEKLEPKVTNLGGQQLDEFRWEGTAELSDKHIGKDPLATDLDNVRREFLDTAEETVSKAAPDARDREPTSAPDEPQDQVEPAAPPRSQQQQPERQQPAQDEAEGGEASDEEPMTMVSPADELERFKQALKSLVRQGTMSRDEAQAAWQTRLKALGLARKAPE